MSIKGRESRRGSYSTKMHLDEDKRVCDKCQTRLRRTRVDGRLFCRTCWEYKDK